MQSMQSMEILRPIHLDGRIYVHITSIQLSDVMNGEERRERVSLVYAMPYGYDPLQPRFLTYVDDKQFLLSFETEGVRVMADMDLLKLIWNDRENLSAIFGMSYGFNMLDEAPDTDNVFIRLYDPKFVESLILQKMDDWMASMQDFQTLKQTLLRYTQHIQTTTGKQHVFAKAERQYDILAEKTAEMLLKNKRTQVLQKRWRDIISNPAYEVCKRRLHWEWFQSFDCL